MDLLHEWVEIEASNSLQPAVAYLYLLKTENLSRDIDKQHRAVMV